jgi:uncharacterized membrane protein YdjX (TVP38/TMEM64 family)
MVSRKQWMPLAVLLALMVVAYFLGLREFLSLHALRTYHDTVKHWTDAHVVLGPLAFLAVDIVATILCLPTSFFMALLSGFLFPQPFCTIYIILGETVGSAILYMAAFRAIGDFFDKKADPTLKKMAAGFNRNAASYMLFLRITPLLPMWLINLAPAAFRVPIHTFIWTTCIGVIPWAFAHTEAGRGIEKILTNGEAFSISGLLNLQIKIALLALGLLALIPILLKRKKG